MTGSTMRRFQISPDAKSLATLRIVTLPIPTPGPEEVLIRMHAVSLNYRDLGLVRSGFPEPSPTRDIVPLSDGAGEIVSTGEHVRRFKIGDRVVLTFFLNWIDGPRRADIQARGAAANDGVLAEYIAVNEAELLGIPDCLTYEEAACLPCAGLTAWAALMEQGKEVRPGHIVLTLGTGGVSLFALQFARAAGARVIITSSSNKKLALAQKLGAWKTINYIDEPAWEKTVLAQTNGRGADHIIELGNATLEQSLEAIAFGGKISLIGVHSGGAGTQTPFALIYKAASIQGIGVGSRAMFKRMMDAIDANAIKPVIYQKFPFADAPRAFETLMAGDNFGKIIIQMPPYA